MSMPTRQAGKRHDCQEAPAVRVEDVPEDVPEVESVEASNSERSSCLGHESVGRNLERLALHF